MGWGGLGGLVLGGATAAIFFGVIKLGGLSPEALNGVLNASVFVVPGAFVAGCIGAIWWATREPAEKPEPPAPPSREVWSGETREREMQVAAWEGAEVLAQIYDSDANEAELEVFRGHFRTRVKQTLETDRLSASFLVHCICQERDPAFREELDALIQS